MTTVWKKFPSLEQFTDVVKKGLQKGNRHIRLFPAPWPLILLETLL